MADITGSRQSNLNLRTIILPMVAIVVLIAYFSIVNPLFLSSSNALNIGRQSAVLLTVALAETMVILIGSIDLSIGAIVTLFVLMQATARVDWSRVFSRDVEAQS